MPTLLRTRVPNKSKVPIPPSPRVPTSGPQLFPHLTAPSLLGQAGPPPPRSAAARACSPARLGPLSVQHELAEAAPERAACEQHRTQLHDQLQHPPSRTYLRRHLEEGQSAAASPRGQGGRREDATHNFRLSRGFFPPTSVRKQSSRSLVLDRRRCSCCRVVFPSDHGGSRVPSCSCKVEN